MVIAELKGGMGNQLFQYAAGIALARHLNTELKVDITSLDTPDVILGTYRKYALSNLLQPPAIVYANELKSIVPSGIQRYLSFIKTNGFKIYREKYFHYNPAFWNLKGSVYLSGNFQSEKYFQPFINDVINSIQFGDIFFSEKEKDMISILKSGESVSVHVRRGDYVSNKIANDVLGALPLNYYEEGMKHIKDMRDIKTVLIFSDDINWAKANLKFIENSFFMEATGANRDLIDFCMMQNCSHNIVANSSFSWWAAYLNPNPDKIVIAPKRWFNKAPYDTKDLIPENWIRI